MIRYSPMVGSWPDRRTGSRSTRRTATLWVANVFGATITQIDPGSGSVLDRLTAADGVAFPDDLIVASNGDIDWTEIVFGAIFKKPAGGPTEELVPPAASTVRIH